MVINIQNVLRTTHLNYTALASTTCGWDHIAQLDFYDYLHCMEQSLCTAAVTVDKEAAFTCLEKHAHSENTGGIFMGE